MFVVAAVVVVVAAHPAAVVQTGGCVFGSRGVRSCVLFESRRWSPLWGEVSMGACGHLPHIVNLVHFVVLHCTVL
jgi:hypothetical protein